LLVLLIEFQEVFVGENSGFWNRLKSGGTGNRPLRWKTGRHLIEFTRPGNPGPGHLMREEFRGFLVAVQEHIQYPHPIEDGGTDDGAISAPGLYILTDFHDFLP
jgi:hypothetical protein